MKKAISGILTVLLLGSLLTISGVTASAYSLSDITFGEPYNYGAGLEEVKLTKGTTTYQDGKPVAITATQGYPSKLQVIDLTTMKLIDALEIPNCNNTCWQMCTANDGSVYFGSYDEGRIYRYDPSTKKITDFGNIGTSNVVGICFDDDGNVWMSGNPSTALYKLNPQTGEITKVIDDKKGSNTVGLSITYHDGKIYYTVINRPADILYVYDIAENTEVSYTKPDSVKYLKYLHAKGDKIMMYVTLPDDTNGVIAFDTKTKQFTDVIATGVDISRHFTPVIDGKVYFMKNLYAHSYDLETGAVEKTSMRYDTILRGSDESLVEIDNAAFPGLNYVNFSMGGAISIFNFQTQTVTLYRDIMEPSPLQLVFSKMGPNDKLYLTSLQGTSAVELDVRTGDRKVFTMSQGESLEFYDEKAYFGCYSAGDLYILDTAQEYGSKNPKILDGVFMEESQQRINSSVMAGDKIVFGSFPNYDELGGALSVFDPETEKLDIYRNIIPNQSILGVTYKDGKIYAGTSISGGLGINATESMPKIFVFDLETRTKIKEIDVNFIPGWESKIKEISGMTIAPDGNLLCATYNVIFKLNIETLALMDYAVVNSAVKYRTDGQKLWYDTFFSYDETTGFYFLKMVANDGLLTILDPDTLDFVNTANYEVNCPTLGSDGNLYYYDDDMNVIKLPVIRGNDKSYILDNRVVLKIGKTNGIVDGALLPIDSENPKIYPFFCDGNVLLPLRYIAEIWGYEVAWDDAGQHAILTKNDESIVVTINSNTIVVNGQSVYAPVKPKEKNGRTFVHFETISDMLDKSVYWNNDLKTLVINKTNGEIPSTELSDIFSYSAEIYNQ